jgi:membrane protease YdiL (CAAX protease family)
MEQSAGRAYGLWYRSSFLGGLGNDSLAGRSCPGPSLAKTLDILLPRGVIESLLWLALSASGFCEEIVYRGYLQRQLRAFTGSGALAVFGQALVFGVGHAYQGWKNVVVTQFWECCMVCW